MRCEICEQPGADFICGALDVPMLSFCAKHYLEHVVGAHGGETYPGSPTIDQACAAMNAGPQEGA